MLHRITSNADGTCTVRQKRSRPRNRNTKILKQPPQPSNLCCHKSYSSQLSLCTRTRNCYLLLSLPTNERTTKKNTISRKRSTIGGITSPSSIRICLKL